MNYIGAIFDCLPVEPLRITSPYGDRKTDIPGATKWHAGVDLGRNRALYSGGSDGGPIHSVLPGKVINSYWNNARGWVIIVDHGVVNGHSVKTLYQHMKAQGLAKGSNAASKQAIGTMGATGVGAQLHLHFELIIDGKNVDPEPYLRNLKKKEEEEEMAQRYNKVSELPKVLQPEIQQIVNTGALKGSDINGDGVNDLNITEDMARVMITMKRYADSKQKG